MALITLEIDGRTVEAEAGTPLIEVADQLGIAIPRFCYHKELSIAANCRMCLVEMAKAPKPVPACATPVAAGMVISTTSQKVRLAQKAVMEFLLKNHPLDCPICDQGGECELQDLSLEYGSAHGDYPLAKRVVPNPDLGSLIATEMNRCIHCTRCVRFGVEIGGIAEMGLTGRGEHARIGTYLEHALESEVSGNMIDLCPVGALTSKPFRFTRRSWEMRQYPGVSLHDALGSHLYWQVHRGEIARVTPRMAKHLNGPWISDRDRFSYLGLKHPNRLLEPRIKRHGHWENCSWEEALAELLARLSPLKEAECKANADLWGAYLHPSLSTEEAFMTQKFMRALGSSWIEHRLNKPLGFAPLREGESLASRYEQQDREKQGIGYPLFPHLGSSLEELLDREAVLLVGCDLLNTVPLLAARLGQKVRAGHLRVFAFDQQLSDQRFAVDMFASTYGEWVFDLALLLQEMRAEHPSGSKAHALPPLEHRVLSDTQKAWLKTMRSFKKIHILLGPHVVGHPHEQSLRYLVYLLSQECGAVLGEISQGANSAGAWIAGAVPFRGPYQKKGLAQGEEDSLEGLRLQMARRVAGLLYLHRDPHPRDWSLFPRPSNIVAMTAFQTPALLEYADLLLPAAIGPESSGTFVNALGQWQTVKGIVSPMGQARPLWKILRVLGHALECPGFEYENPLDILTELQAEGGIVAKTVDYPKAEFPIILTQWPQALTPEQQALYGLSPALYQSDLLVAHAEALQNTPRGKGLLSKECL